jgi:hypothetical protein
MASIEMQAEMLKVAAVIQFEETQRKPTFSKPESGEVFILEETRYPLQ